MDRDLARAVNVKLFLKCSLLLTTMVTGSQSDVAVTAYIELERPISWDILSYW
jgi:hypothetical protein